MIVWPCNLPTLAKRTGHELGELRRLVQQKLLKVHLDESRANHAANHPLFNWAAVVGSGCRFASWRPDAGSLVAVHEWTGSFAVDPLHIKYVRATEDEHPSLAAVFDKMESESAACRDAHKLLVGLDTRYAFLGVSSLDLTVDDIWVTEASANAAGLTGEKLPRKPDSDDGRRYIRRAVIRLLSDNPGCWNTRPVDGPLPKRTALRDLIAAAASAPGWSRGSIDRQLDWVTGWPAEYENDDAYDQMAAMRVGLAR